MTTKITVDAHAGWPVKVTPIDNGINGRETIVPPHTKADFFVWDTRQLIVEEMKR